MRHILLVFLVACGSANKFPCGNQKVKVIAVDEQWADTFDALAADIYELSGRRPFLAGALSVSIIVSAEKLIAETNRHPDSGSTVDGMYSARDAAIYVPPMDDWVDYGNGSRFKPSPAYAPILLGHELGHALGLAHAPTGLMTEYSSLECEGRVAECLCEALEAHRTPY